MNIHLEMNIVMKKIASCFALYFLQFARNNRFYVSPRYVNLNGYQNRTFRKTLKNQALCFSFKYNNILYQISLMIIVHYVQLSST